MKDRAPVLLPVLQPRLLLRPLFVRLPVLKPVLLLGVAAVLAGSCSPSTETPPSEATPAEPGPPEAAERTAAEVPSAEIPSGEAPPAVSEGPLVVFLGDSLTAGMGVGEAEAFPEQVRLSLAAEGVDLRVVNAGISGDTTAGGLARLEWVLRQEPEILVVGLGANDGLRGLALEETEANLRAIVERAQRDGVRVLLLGMMLPPNYGPEYTDGFREIFPRLSRELETPLVPFLLTGVAGRPGLNQPDGIHPTAEGHRLMAENVAPRLGPMLQPGS